MAVTFEFLDKEALSKRKKYDEETNEIMGKLFDADWCFSQIVDAFNNAGDEEEDEEEAVDVFADFCEHIKDIYQIFCESDVKDVMMRALQPFHKLVEIKEYSEWLDEECSRTIQFMALVTVHAILNINDSLRFNELPDSGKLSAEIGGINVWYDFENDTPEIVYQRFKEACIKFWGE